MHHVARHIGQPVVAALVLERQPGVVDAEAVQHRGMQVVDVHRLVDDVVAVVVGLTSSDPRLDAAARHPHGEAARVVVATVVVA